MANKACSKRVCFTAFPDISPDAPEWNPNLDKFDYLVAGLEVCPETKRVHIQGYAICKNTMRIKALQTALDAPNCHIENAKGTPEQNRTYCTKEGKILLESGECPPDQQGKRNDLLKVANLIQSGERPSYLDLVTEHHISSYAALKAYDLLLSDQKPTFREVQVFWYYGPSGSGKTHAAFTESENPWVKPVTTAFFDGYRGQTHVIFDDLRPQDFRFSQLLRLLDKYPCSVDGKGTKSVPWLATHIWITTPYHPKRFVPSGEDYKQLRRRITTKREFDIDEKQ